MNVSLTNMEGNCGAINADDYTWHGCYIIIFYSYIYSFQANLSIDGQVIFSVEMVCEGTHFLNRYQF